ncbi:MAG: hypothetical protein HHAS10_01520 [Candidatus Altimarinota bacterium]
MTAIVVVLNKNGVGIAADRAGSVNGEVTKVFDSNKLFRLSRTIPVGLSVYANSEFMGVPWEILVKEYKKNDKCLHSIGDYKSDFIKFLGNFDLHDPTPLERQVIYHFFSKLRSKTITTIDRAIDNNPGLNYDQITEIIKNEIILNTYNDINLSVKQVSPNIGMTSKMINDIIKGNIELIAGQIKIIFKNIELKNEDLELLIKAIKLELKYFIYWKSYSGVIITGFGKNDIFPSLKEIIFYGKIYGKIIYKDGEDFAITHKVTGGIIPFAQKDVVQNIINGINPLVEGNLKSETMALINKSKLSKPNKELLNKSIIEKFSETKRAYSEKLVNMLEFFSINELGNIAETLINLTSFNRRVRMEDESVGLGTDVAIISKYDGFIWSKRKHYFEPNLNPHYFK